jgi:hypothetical protein
VFKYGNNKPPEYNLAAITSTVSLIVGPNDWLATPEVSKSYSHLLNSRVLQNFQGKGIYDALTLFTAAIV